MANNTKLRSVHYLVYYHTSLVILILGQFKMEIFASFYLQCIFHMVLTAVYVPLGVATANQICGSKGGSEGLHLCGGIQADPR